MARDIAKETLYESVKALVECESKHIHLNQQKLFTQFSIAFQYLIYKSTKVPGHYIIRIEDSFLAEKLARKSKDVNSRKFMGRLLIPRRLKYGKSMFHLDYFQPASWNKTSELPPEKIKAALIVKNTSQAAPMEEMMDLGEDVEMVTVPKVDASLYLKTLTSFLPETITIAFGEEYEGLSELQFPFIQAETDNAIAGVKISKDMNFN